MISLIIPCYNPEYYILEIVKNKIQILENYFEKYEIIIVNDGSKKEHNPTFAQLSNINRSVRVISQKNKGVSAARNFGVHNANFNIVSFCDADDMWDNRKIEIDYTLMMENKLRIIGSMKRKSRDYFLTIKKLKAINQLYKWGPHVSSIILEKKLFEEIGGFNEEMKRAEDGDFYLKVINHLGYFPVVNTTLIYNYQDKRSFGESGLSANLEGMLQGEINAVINNLSYYYYPLIIFLVFKYFLRKIKVILIRL